VAATLTADNELIYASFPVEKVEETSDGDLMVWGKVSDGTVDGDLQIVDPDWSLKALREWFDTGANVRVQHQSQRDPAGRGLELDGHYLKALVVEPVAKRLVKAGALGYYSLGISRPDIRYERNPKLDPEGKAIGGIITGRKDGTSHIPEVSLVDRGSNHNSRFQLVKAAADGTCEWVGKMIGADDEVTKAAHEDADTVTLELPKDVSFSFNPTDLKKLLDHREIAEKREAVAVKAIADAEYHVYKRDIDTATRRRLADQGRALPNLSYPIETHEDADNAVTLALSGHGNVAAAKKLIRRIASKEGWQDILDRLDGKSNDDDASKAAKCGTCHGTGKIMDGHRDCPDCDGPAKDDDDAQKALAKALEAADAFAAAVNQAKDAAQRAGLPEPVFKSDGEEAEEGDEGGSESGGGALHHDDGEDDDTDSDADAMDKAAEPTMTKPPKVPCPKCAKKMKPSAKFCGKCGASMSSEKASKPTPADHAEGAAESAIQPAPEHREPDGPVVESFEHDAGLPTVPDAGAMPMKVAALHKALGVPYDAGWLHDLTCPAFDPATAKAAHPLADLSMLDELAWQAKALDTAARAPLDQAREAALLWQHALTVKTTPPDVAGEILAEAHKAFRDANPGPGKAPVPGEIPASRFHRPYITDGHAAPSPGYDPPHRDPVHAGHISASDFQRGPQTEGLAADSPGNANPRPTPIPAPEVPGVPSRVYYSRMQRDNARQAMTAMHDHIARTFPDVCPMYGPGHMGEPGAGTRPVPVGVGGPVPHGASKAEGGDVTTTEETPPITRITPKQLRRKLEKAVLAGEVSIDDARVQLGLQPFGASFAAKALTAEPVALEASVGQIGVDPEVIKAAVAEAVNPLLERLDKADKRLKEQGKVLDAIADQPDPNVTAYRGVALMGPPAAKAAVPAGTMAEHAERAQATLFNAMYTQWRTASTPEDREYAWDAMREMTGLKPGVSA
jgi:hypothetical protein